MFNLSSKFKASIHQQKAYKQIAANIKNSNKFNTLLGVTGSGKTFTMANLINELQMPTLILTHNKSLASQLYSEFKGFFPNNHVEYFISYYDYYQPEAYLPRRDLFIEKDSSINSELERLRLSASSSILSHKDCIIIASVSANYGLGDPSEYQGNLIDLEVGQEINLRNFLLRLIEIGYSRNDNFFDRGNFRVNGEIIDIYPAYWGDKAIKIELFGDEIERISHFDVLKNEKLQNLNKFRLYGASQFIVSKDRLNNAIQNIEIELDQRLKFYKDNDRLVEYERLKQRVEFDLEMLRETGMCKGVENYSRHLTNLKAGQTPYSMFDYFALNNGSDFLVIVDESHVSLPQFGAMYAGDRSRKEVLVEYGFRLPSALDNRPLKFDEFINKNANFLFVSATPSELELNLSNGCVVEQILRPTGLLDPKIIIKDSDNGVEVLYDLMKEKIAKNQRILICVLTKKMASELSKYYLELGLKARYMHSDIDTPARNELIRDLRLGNYDILIGINLLREGLDLPEVSLVAIFDADKAGFLRSKTSLIQIIGRAARNVEGEVIMFAKNISPAMQYAIDITQKRREIQQKYNDKNGIIPKNVSRNIEQSLSEQEEVKIKKKIPQSEKSKIIEELRKQMLKASENLEFEKAIALRDEIARIRKI